MLQFGFTTRNLAAGLVTERAYDLRPYWHRAVTTGLFPLSRGPTSLGTWRTGSGWEDLLASRPIRGFVV
jgi:hypothetical protein